MKAITSETYVIPTFYAGLIFNADRTGLTAQELDAFNDFENMIIDRAGELNACWDIDAPQDIDGVKYFSWTNDVTPGRMGCDVAEFKITYFELIK